MTTDDDCGPSDEPSDPPEGDFSFVRRETGDIVISFRGRVTTVLRGVPASRFLAELRDGDPQELMKAASNGES